MPGSETATPPQPPQSDGRSEIDHLPNYEGLVSGLADLYTMDPNDIPEAAKESVFNRLDRYTHGAGDNEEAVISHLNQDVKRELRERASKGLITDEAADAAVAEVDSYDGPEHAFSGSQ